MLKSIAILLSGSVRCGVRGAHPAHRPIAGLTTTTSAKRAKFLMCRRGGVKLLGVNELRANIEIGARAKKRDLHGFAVGRGGFGWRAVARAGRVVMMSVNTPLSHSRPPEPLMRHVAVWSFIILGLAVTQGLGEAPQPPHVASTPHLTPEQEKAKIHLPPGFELQLVASEPDIHKPMNMCFDERGRLWLTDSVEYPFPVPVGKPGRDRVMILDDFGPAGKARKITTFAEGLNIPIGILPYQNGCIVWSLPNVLRLSDTDGDGKADKTEVLFGPFGHADTHGNVNSFTIGFDGWMYACHGYLNNSTIKGKDGQELFMNSGNTFRIKLDGSHCEAFTRGQVNPFGLAWDPLGNLYSADCHSMPITQLLRGGFYQSFGKQDDGLGFAPHMIDFGQQHSTALCGLVYYDADQFPAEYRGQMFLGDVVLNRVNSYKIERNGSSPKAVFQKFLTSDDPWFRPNDLKLGPDGAIYVSDFYNKIIGHYEVPLNHAGRDRTSGRIWRIVYKGAKDNVPPPKRPYDDLRKESVEKLSELLGHANITVRMQAMNEMASRGAVAKDAAVRLLLSESESQRVHALWVLQRIGALDDKLLEIPQALERSWDGKVHVARVMAEREKITDKQRDWLIKALKHPDMLLRRCAVEALGRHPDAKSAVPVLMDLEIREKDEHLAQVARMAVRDHVKAGLYWKLKASDFPGYSNQLVEAMYGAPSPEAAEFLLTLRPTIVTVRDAEFIARNGSDSAVAEMIKKSHVNPRNLVGQLERFRATQRGIQSRGAALPKPAVEWAVKLCDSLLVSADRELKKAGTEIAGSLKLEAKQDTLLKIARDAKQPEDVQAAALTALVAIAPDKHIGLLGLILRDRSASAGLRSSAARTLGTLNRPESRAELIQAFAHVSADLATGIAAGLSATPQGGEELLAAVTAGKASPQLLLDRAVQNQLRQHRLRNLDQRLTKLTAGLPALDDKIAQLIRDRAKSLAEAKPDLEAGKKVYAKHCAACHQLAGQGAKVGPQLDGIGARSAERLLEDILDPNRNVDPAFRATRLSLKDGRDLQGLVLREEGEVVVMADNQGKEIRIEKKQIDERTISPLSPMPANWAEVIPAREFIDLMGFLLSQRAK
jgi:putative heme-binding domain-containing protein